MTTEQVVVVGAAAAGLTTAETLRREGFAGAITFVGDELHAPYDRPPLSKQFMAGTWGPERIALRTPETLAALDAQWRLGVRAESLSLSDRQLALSSGDMLGFDHLVIATGVSPRILPNPEGLSGIHTLKTLDDAIALRAALVSHPKVVVVGGGPLGAEFAAAARAYSDEVTLVDRGPAPLHRHLGSTVAGLIADLHAAHGVRLIQNQGVTNVIGTRGHITAVQLTDGSTLPADLVVVAIGSTPNTGWLAGSGVPVDDGVHCGSTCTAAPGVYAAGDVARWPHPVHGSLRLEHRMNATEQGMAVAHAILGQATPFAPIPYFWTDHYDTTIQVRGRCTGGSDFVVADGNPSDGRFVGLYGNGRRVTAVLSWNSVRRAREFHHLLASPDNWREATAELAGTTGGRNE
jgi:NADPH-dependent 2,4-dienoyl-CoA reductase/sulfur reductase-like enzyme